jgi:hypothetical protein
MWDRVSMYCSLKEVHCYQPLMLRMTVNKQGALRYTEKNMIQHHFVHKFHMNGLQNEHKTSVVRNHQLTTQAFAQLCKSFMWGCQIMHCDSLCFSWCSALLLFFLFKFAFITSLSSNICNTSPCTPVEYGSQESSVSIVTRLQDAWLKN